MSQTLYALGEGTADWPLADLLAFVADKREELGAENLVALYVAWIARHDGVEALLGRFNLAAVLQQMGQSEAAETEYRQVLRGVDLPPARHNLGLLLEASGRELEARAQWELVAVSGAEPASRLAALQALTRMARREGRSDRVVAALEQALAIAPEQPGLAQELALLRQTGAARMAAGSAEPVVYVFAVCFNEAAILPFFLDHYINHVGAAKVVLRDGGSTDGSAEIAARWPQVEFIHAPSEKLDDRALMQMRNEAWKPLREDCDWVVVCDVDEFLWAPDVRGLLKTLKSQGITLPMVEGFNISSKLHPPFRPGRFLWQDRQSGSGDPRYLNKNLIFDPAIDINYTLGCHHCQPSGPVRRSEGFVFKSLHMCTLSYEHFLSKSLRSAARLSDWNRQTNAGFHYRLHAGMGRAEFNARFMSADNVLAPRPNPAPARAWFEVLRSRLLDTPADARVLTLGLDRGRGTDFERSMTAWLAWFVHTYGGACLLLEAEPRARRHAAHELARLGLAGERVMLAKEGDLRVFEDDGAAPFDLLHLAAADDWGDEADRATARRRALGAFLDAEPRLAPGAWVVLEGECSIDDPAQMFSLLMQLLTGRGWQARCLDGLTLLSPPARQ